jgi:DNA-binding transcriptional LysR family regulator
VDKFDAMQMFVRAIEKGSFSAVAKERGIGQPAVSKQISALEDELGTELIHRTSRSIALTEAGRDFYESALHILGDFENATSRIGRGQTAPKGLISCDRSSHVCSPPYGVKAARFFCCLP